MSNKASKRYSSQEVIMSHGENQDSIQNLQESIFQVPKYSALQKVNRRNNLNYVYGKIKNNSKSKRSSQKKKSSMNIKSFKINDTSHQETELHSRVNSQE